MTWISLMRFHRCQRNSVTLPYTTLFKQQCLALAKSEHCFCVMTLHRGSLTNVPSNWPGAPSRVYSRTLATTCQLFGLVCASLVLTSVLLLSLVQVVSVVHLCYKYPWDPCNTSLHGRYLTTPVSSEAVGNCLITLSVGVSRTPVACVGSRKSDRNMRLCPWPLDLRRIGLLPSPPMKRFSEMSASLTTLVAMLLFEICANVVLRWVLT